MHLICKMATHVGWFFALTFTFAIAVAPLATAQTQSGLVLRGVVTLDQPASGGVILIYDGARLIQNGGNRKFYNGAFSMPLNATASALLATGDLRVEVQLYQPSGVRQGSSVRLMADLHEFDPATQVIFINPITTIVAAYRQIEPAASLDQANAAAARNLGLPTAGAAACQSTHLNDVDNRALLSASEQAGGFDAFVRSAARAARAGDTGVRDAPSGGAPAAAGPDFRKVFIGIAKEIANEAVGSVPFGKVVSGWVLDEIFKAPSQTKQEKDLIGPQLHEIAAQLDQILAGIANLSLQIADSEKRITDQIKLAAYQQQAQDIRKDINALCNMQRDLVFLATQDPNEDNSDLAAILQTKIVSTVADHLSNIWSGLEGENSLSVPGLINRWSDLVGPGPGFPLFTDNRYLKPAVANFNYYLGAEVVALNLLVEYAHSVQAKKPSTASALIQRALKDFDAHYDTQKRRVAHDVEIGSGPKQRFAAEILPSDDWAIDTRSGLMWRLRNICDEGQKAPDCLFFTYYKQGDFEPQIHSVTRWFGDFFNTTKLPDIEHWRSFDPKVPTRDQWGALFAGWNSSKNNKKKSFTNPYAYLNANGFSLPTNTIYSYWTSEVAKKPANSNPYGQYFPDWANWVVDLRNGVFWFEYEADRGSRIPIGIALLLVEGAATELNVAEKIPAMIYRSMQDAITPPPKRRTAGAL